MKLQQYDDKDNNCLIMQGRAKSEEGIIDMDKLPSISWTTAFCTDVLASFPKTEEAEDTAMNHVRHSTSLSVCTDSS